jgi:hypothetical protein
MKDGRYLFAIGIMLDNFTTWRHNVKVRITKSKALTRLWRRAYRPWLDDGEEVFRVLGWRTAIIKKRGTVRAMTACFWIFQ